MFERFTASEQEEIRNRAEAHIAEVESVTVRLNRLIAQEEQHLKAYMVYTGFTQEPSDLYRDVGPNAPQEPQSECLRNYVAWQMALDLFRTKQIGLAQQLSETRMRIAACRERLSRLVNVRS